MARRRNRSPTSTIVVSDENVGIFTVDVEVKVAGVDLKELSSDRKVFAVNGREHPMSRFGSWVFQDSVEEKTRKICIDGGIIPSLTWSLQLICPQVEVWVKDITRCRFSLIMKNEEKSSVLDKITGGAKAMERILREKIPAIYGNVRIILIKLLGSSNEASQSTNGNASGGSGKEYLSRISVLRDFECVSNLIDARNYGLAYARLKQMVDGEITDTERIQILIRLGICCCHLQKFDEIQDTVARVQSIAGKMEDCASPMDKFSEDIAIFAEKLSESGMFVHGMDTILACNKMLRKIDDPDKLLDKFLFNIMICCALMKNAIYTAPMARVKDEIRKCVEMLNEEVEQIKNLKGCDPLGQSRAVYYSLHMLSGINDHLGGTIFNASDKGPAGVRFSCIASAWADFTNVLSLGERHPEIAMMLRDRLFTKMVKEISDNPLLLEKRIMDPRIMQINAILNKDFFKASPMTPFTGNGFGGLEFEIFQHMMRQNFGPSGILDRKRQSQLEKEKGNEAYKKKQYDKALGHYDKAIELDPSDALIHNNKAAVFISKDELPKARESCLTALRIAQSSNGGQTNMDVAKILARLARVDFLSRRLDAAMAFYQKSLRLHDDAKVREQMEECGEAIITRNILAGFAMF